MFSCFPYSTFSTTKNTQYTNIAVLNGPSIPNSTNERKTNHHNRRNFIKKPNMIISVFGRNFYVAWLSVVHVLLALPFNSRILVIYKCNKKSHFWIVSCRRTKWKKNDLGIYLWTYNIYYTAKRRRKKMIRSDIMLVVGRCIYIVVMGLWW